MSAVTATSPGPQPIKAHNLTGLDGIRHGFFTREGGVSEGIYAGLNVGLGSKDNRAHVLENRTRVARALGFPDAPLLTLYQVHSATAVTVTEPFAESPPRADALVTNTPGLIIGALAADCTPVLFADDEAKVVAAAHAGWRGAVGGVLEAAIKAMEALGAVRTRISAAIGPTINQQAYEVGPEFEAEFIAADASNARFFTKPSGTARAHFDLPAFVESRLQAADLKNVERQTVCTYANDSRFYSYRRSTHRGEPDYGRQISAIVVA